MNRELEDIGAPVLLMQGDPRQVVTANTAALALFGKSRHDVEGHRGGEVFDCLHSFSEPGCGKDPNCESCRIRQAIVRTFETGESSRGVAVSLPVKKGAREEMRTLQVSTEKVGDLALVTVERYE